MTGEVRVRFAPSPTGYLHVGGARTALFNWLFARRHGGRFILRMEDTDHRRNTPEARQTIFDGLRWLGLSPDEGPEEGGPHGPYSQSERGSLYESAVQDLKATGCLYPCFCSRERLAEVRARQEADRVPFRYDRACRDLAEGAAQARIDGGEAATWRLRVPDGETVLEDLVRGTITVPNADIEDIILLRADGTVVYNLAVVIDDHDMRISHVLRGEDHLTNTFKQLLLFDALGWERPLFGHLPLILGPTGQGKLSKRKHPEAALEHYISRDWPREALINWLAFIGWSLDDKTDIISEADLIANFSLDRVHSKGARLPLDKLNALGGHYIRQMPVEEIARHIGEHLKARGWVADADQPESAARILHIAELMRERLNAFSEIVEQMAWLFEPIAEYELKALKNLRKNPEAPAILREYAASLPDPLGSPDELEAYARTFAETRPVGFGQLVHPVRAALTGRAGGPPLFDCLALLGREEALRRFEAGATRAEAAAAES